MVYRLTLKDIDWLRVNHPGLQYIPDANIIIGTFSFSAKFQDKETINDEFDIKIDLDSLKHERLPLVYETGCKIKRIAKIHNLPLDNFHQYQNGELCLIRPDKIDKWYKNGFDLKTFFKHLKTYFYWVCYKDRYGKEPWKGEKHGW